MKITVETIVKAELNKVWSAWNNPEDIKQWNTASDDWHTTQSRVDLRDGRHVKVEFSERGGEVLVREIFDAETENSPEMQRAGWQAILDNFARHVRRRS